MAPPKKSFGPQHFWGGKTWQTLVQKKKKASTNDGPPPKNVWAPYILGGQNIDERWSKKKKNKKKRKKKQKKKKEQKKKKGKKQKQKKKKKKKPPDPILKKIEKKTNFNAPPQLPSRGVSKGEDHKKDDIHTIILLQYEIVSDIWD